jgi:hypothetical protein
MIDALEVMADDTCTSTVLILKWVQREFQEFKEDLGLMDARREW